MPSRTQALAYRAVPMIIIVGLAFFAIFGRGGVLDNLELAEQAEEKREAWLALELGNDRDLYEIERLRADPLEVERKAADAHRVARPGTTLYVFEGDELVQAP